MLLVLLELLLLLLSSMLPCELVDANDTMTGAAEYPLYTSEQRGTLAREPTENARCRELADYVENNNASN